MSVVILPMHIGVFPEGPEFTLPIAECSPFIAKSLNSHAVIRFGSHTVDLSVKQIFGLECHNFFTYKLAHLQKKNLPRQY